MRHIKIFNKIYFGFLWCRPITRVGLYAQLRRGRAAVVALNMLKHQCKKSHFRKFITKEKKLVTTSCLRFRKGQ